MPRPVRMFSLPSGFGEGRASQPYASAAALRTARERARRNPRSSFVPAVEHLDAELQRIGLRRCRHFVDERFGGKCRLRTIRIAQVAGAKRRLPHSGRLTTSPTIRRLGMAYISDGIEALPAAGLARRDPMSCAISTVSGSLYPTWL